MYFFPSLPLHWAVYLPAAGFYGRIVFINPSQHSPLPRAQGGTESSELPQQLAADLGPVRSGFDPRVVHQLSFFGRSPGSWLRGHGARPSAPPHPRPVARQPPAPPRWGTQGPAGRAPPMRTFVSPGFPFPMILPSPDPRPPLVPDPCPPFPGPQYPPCPPPDPDPCPLPPAEVVGGTPQPAPPPHRPPLRVAPRPMDGISRLQFASVARPPTVFHELPPGPRQPARGTGLSLPSPALGPPTFLTQSSTGGGVHYSEWGFTGVILCPVFLDLTPHPRQT